MNKYSHLPEFAWGLSDGVIPRPPEPTQSNFGRFLFASVGIHIVFLLSMLIVNGPSKKSNDYTPKVTSVRIVSFDQLSMKKQTIPKAPSNAAVISKPKEKTVPQKKIVPVQPKKPTRIPAVVPIPKRDSDADAMGSLEKFLANLEQSVEAEDTADDLIIPDDAWMGSRGSTLGNVEQGGIITKFYLNEVEDTLIMNWRASPSAIEFNYSAVVSLRIDKDGTIGAFEFKSNSGDQSFVDSIERAIIKSSPLPAIPDDYDGENLFCSVTFDAVEDGFAQ